MMLKIRSGKETRAWVHCPICTHTVEARVLRLGKTARVKVGEKCARCGTSLDAGWVLDPPMAA